MIGPEPMRRIEVRSVRLGIQYVLKALVERDLGLPAGRGPNLGRISYQMGDVRTTQEPGVGLRSHGPGRQSLQAFEDFPDAVAFAGSDVVDRTGSPPLGQGQIGGVVAVGLETGESEILAETGVQRAVEIIQQVV